MRVWGESFKAYIVRALPFFVPALLVLVDYIAEQLNLLVLPAQFKAVVIILSPAVFDYIRMQLKEAAKRNTGEKAASAQSPGTASNIPPDQFPNVQPTVVDFFPEKKNTP